MELEGLLYLMIFPLLVLIGVLRTSRTDNKSNLITKPRKYCRECNVDISYEYEDVLLCGDCYLNATNKV